MSVVLLQFSNEIMNVVKQFKISEFIKKNNSSEIVNLIFSNYYFIFSGIFCFIYYVFNNYEKSEKISRFFRYIKFIFYKEFKFIFTINTYDTGDYFNPNRNHNYEIFRPLLYFLNKKHEKKNILIKYKNMMNINVNDTCIEKKYEINSIPYKIIYKDDNNNKFFIYYQRDDPVSVKKLKKGSMISSIESESEECLCKHYFRIYTKNIDAFNSFLKKITKEYTESNLVFDKYNYIYNINTSLSDPIPRKNSRIKYLNEYYFNNDTSFDNLFIEEKKDFLNYIKLFKNGQYKYISLLLHGKPGTGKTSIIKMLSKYLNRSILYVKLSEINSIKSLLDIFYSNSFYVSSNKFKIGRTIETQLNNSDKIIVFEDIDAECPMVLKRELYEEILRKEKKERNKEDEILKILSKKEEETTIKFNESKLTLSDILQIFNGVIPLDKHVIITTTNHKDKLDPALIRSGRITYDLELNDISNKTIKKMIKHHFKNIDDKTIDEKIKIESINPSKLEYLILTKISFDNLCKALEKI